LRPDDLSDGRRVAMLAEAMRQNRTVPFDYLVNTFERPAVEQFTDIRTAFDLVRQAAGTPLLCGAGPTVLSVHPDEPGAREVAERLGGTDREAFVVGTARRDLAIAV
jgi:4-diphosphocytidyl-2C-methyl-D-erythritol kinase